MPFRRFFERGAKPSIPTPAAESADADATDSAAEGLEEDSAADESSTGPAEDAPELEWRERAAVVLPTQASTGSKRPESLYGTASPLAPTHFTRAVGCSVYDTVDRRYIDCTMALGSVAIGYAEPNVTRAVVDAIASGNVSGLSPVREVDLAERLCGVIPCAEMVQFLKTGAEAVAAAVRLARAYTRRDLVLGCGYFGWGDWSSQALGVPDGVRADFRRIPFDDVEALEREVEGAAPQLAAIVIEPVIERLPAAEWIARARSLCDRHGAVLVFDEVKTGFRLKTGGYQEFSGVIPDLAAFGKAMANGFPLAAVAGRRDVMLTARSTWISSTLASEGTALAAASVVLDWHEQVDVCASLWSIGREIRAAVDAAVVASGVRGVSLRGIDPMWLIEFDDAARQTRFLELAAGNGVLFKRGAYNFAALAHDEEAITLIEAGTSAALVELVEEEERR